MTQPIRVALAAAGAFGVKHLDDIRNIEGVEVMSLVSRDLQATRLACCESEAVDHGVIIPQLTAAADVERWPSKVATKRVHSARRRCH
jgi:predicted homoserine dehydrogenase-like protein